MTITVQEAISSRCKAADLTYEDCVVIFLDWHPARDGRHYAVIFKHNRLAEMWLKPETLLGMAHEKNGDSAPVSID